MTRFGLTSPLQNFYKRGIMGYIYKITNDVNGKIYIGKTEHDNPEDRWKEHLRDYKKERCEKRPLYEAMNKYGTEYFHFEVLEETENTIEREQYWINELRTYIGFEDCIGYNATLGGVGKCYLNLDENEVIQYHTFDATYICGDTAKHFNVDKGTIQRILKKHNIFWLKTKGAGQMKRFLSHGTLYQISMKTKQIVNQFCNVDEASNETGFGNSSIRDACHNRRGHHYSNGYAWYYENDMKQAIENKDFIDYFKECT